MVALKVRVRKFYCYNELDTTGCLSTPQIPRDVEAALKYSYDDIYIYKCTNSRSKYPEKPYAKYTGEYGKSKCVLNQWSDIKCHSTYYIYK